ncbi:uncharacterized protein A4U43_C07F3010 [Asparagus officinalis]|uniref:DUF674 domain-containing protein n=1 Tax=Asparagus officinalis TaxID=4686 RepID=A0A5P1E9E0_ASPOF|nr:uncharacterized protein LOC109850028 [Asparagus officinalis]ONK62353.1 uncharacterized protein A4U43_C07F3010 [Asparagus officinalis]
MVSDDLVVRPVSMGESLGLMSRLGIEDGSVLEKRVVNVGKEEISTLLKRSLVSKMPLTDVFLQEPDGVVVEEKLMVADITQSRGKQKKIATDSKRIHVKLYLDADSDKVVYAEAGDDFADLLFSFLTFPLGAVVKLLEKNSSMGSIDNLYKSVELLSKDFGYMKSEELRDMLLAPMLPPHFGCQHNLLSIEEVFPQKITTCACKTKIRGQCVHGMGQIYDEINPKQDNSSLGNGEGYARGMMKFMVTDEMKVTPLSPISGFHIIKKLMVPISSLEEAEASLGETEALNLLKACLISNTVLSDVFSPYTLTLLEQNWCGRLPRKIDGF